ncbi:hypothetical protein BcepF1.088 [Burkholderia phage BcepF1]|uniref:Uncharacterized protein n=1 Tax=Burkholderia phage BcepF1 TaxID=2886897 RepID=A1YZZ2_9CAUD|nr:hypothetical protein BcepF1.088 [Burkholderia phage BcepF1]ABL96819.1 hypothetical protein BcepF1.088 [Burkholderia phage BcepF1]
MNAAIEPDVFYVDRTGKVYPAKTVEKNVDYLIELADGSQTRTSEFNLFKTRTAANIAAVTRVSQNFGNNREPKTFFQK